MLLPILDHMRTWAVIVAAGVSSRCEGAVPKQFRQISGRPLLSWTISRFEAAETIDKIVLVVAEEHLLYTNESVVDPFGFTKVTKLIKGGETRFESVLAGLESLPISTNFVAIHDGARPLVQPSDIDLVVRKAHKEKAAILAAPIADTVKRVHGDYIIATLDRTKLFAAQTPQVFQYDLILESYRKHAGQSESIPTDDAQLIEAVGFKVQTVKPSGLNIKVTTPADLALAELLLERESQSEPANRPGL